MKLFGWKAIQDYLTMPPRVVAHLVKHEGLPHMKAGGTIYTTTELLDAFILLKCKEAAWSPFWESFTRKLGRHRAEEGVVQYTALIAEAKRRGFWEDPPQVYVESGQKRIQNRKKIWTEIQRFPE